MQLPKTYYGGKESSGVYQTIINYIPPHETYIELFLGRGVIMRRKKPAPQYNIGCEIDRELCLKWHQYKLTHNLPYIIHNLCGIELLKEIKDNPIYTTLGRLVYIYCDPPYLIESRKSKRNVYKHELTREQHIKLLQLINIVPFNVSISCYDNDLYSEYLSSWNKIQFKSQTRKGQVTETLYFNYPVPEQLHDYRYLGENFRERHRIHKKIQRHVEGLKRLPVQERNAIIQAINNNT